MKLAYRIPLCLDPQPEGGYVVTSPDLPELVTEGDTVDEALEHAREAIAAVVEMYEEDGRALPSSIEQITPNQSFRTEQLYATA